jgi:hypothetical protein
MAELVDAPDSKSGSGNRVWVRFPLRAPARQHNIAVSPITDDLPSALPRASFKKTGIA